MKVDGLGVILAIIIMPIILVVTYYIQLQVDTIAQENSYNTKLLDATYDAMSAFEINTANEKLSSVADSMRSIILASNNIFFNTLATNFGVSNASKETLKDNIPAMLYTLYDGYYIYSPTEIPVIAEKTKKYDRSTISADKTSGKDESEDLISTEGYYFYGEIDSTTNDQIVSDSEIDGINSKTTYGDVLYVADSKYGKKYTVDIEHAETKIDYVLKSYVQYSANYKNETDTINVTINYTLDNYLNITGTVDNSGIYYTKTGYLIDKNLVSNQFFINGESKELKNYNEDDIKNMILGKKKDSTGDGVDALDSVSVTVKGKEITSNFASIKNIIKMTLDLDITTIAEAEERLEKCYELYNSGSDKISFADIQNLEYEIQKCRAVAYYTSSSIFSNWVYEKLGELKYSDIQDGSMTNYLVGEDNEGNPIYKTTSNDKYDLYYNFHTGQNLNIFETSGEHSDPEDTESNFNIHRIEVIKNSIKYNLNLVMSAYNKVPKKLDFKSSLPVLLDEEWDKILSNVSIVSFMQGLDCGLSVYNNYEIVSSTNNELTVTPSEIYYVKKNEFDDGNGNYHRIDCPDGDFKSISATDEYIAFKSKEVKYDKILSSDSNTRYIYDHRNLACYTCINTNNYKTLFSDPKQTSYYAKIESLPDDQIAKKVAAYIAIASERQKIYKMNALPVSEGYCVTNKKITSSNGKVSVSLNTILENATKLKITISNTKINANGVNKEPILKLKLKIGGYEGKSIELNLGQTLAQTVTVDVTDLNLAGGSKLVEFEKESPGYNVLYDVESIKVIYK